MSLAPRKSFDILALYKSDYYYYYYNLCFTPKSHKGWLKTGIVNLTLPFISSLQVIKDASNLVCGLNISSPSLQMTNSA